MARILSLLFLALILSSCATKPPAAVPLPRVTWAMANEYLWTDAEKAVVRHAMREINMSCGRELLRENDHTPVMTLHTKKLAFFEAELFGGGILGLADPPTKSAAFYPLAFYSPEVLHATAVHEVLHLMGMRHTDRPDSIMRPTLEGEEHMSQLDVADLNTFGWQCPNG